MKRQEFSRSVKVEAVKRATRNGEIYCEECHVLCKSKFEIDHVIPTRMGGSAEISNARVLCRACHAEKTKADIPQIAKAKRREAKNLGVKKSTIAIKSRGFERVERPRAIDKAALPELPRRGLYQ